MSKISKEDVQHLGTLSRIRITETEVQKLQEDISAILEYVSTINEVVDEGTLEKVPGPVCNVFRDDKVTNEPGSFTKDLQAEMPERHGEYLKVKKILDQKKG